MPTPNQSLEYILRLNQADLMMGLNEVFKKVEKLDTGMESLEKKLGKHNESNRKAMGLQRGMINDLTRNLQHLTYWRDKSFNTASIDKFNKKIKETQAEIAKLRQENQQEASGGGMSLGGMLRGAGAMAAAYWMYGAAKDSVMMAAKQQGLRNAIRFSSGNESEGNQSLEFLDDESRRMGINKLSMMQGFKTFSGGFLGSKTGLEAQRKMFSQINAGIVAMNLTGDDAQGVYLALGQIMSKGKVQAEELRGQIGERIPGAFAIAARAMGVTQQQLNKMLDNGEILSDVFMPKFAAEVEKTFGKQVPQASQSLQAALNRAQNSSDNLMTAIGDKLSPAVKTLAQIFGEAADGVTKYLKGAHPLANELSDQQDEFNGLITAMKDTNLGTDYRKNIIEEIISKYGEYLPKLEKEKDLYQQIANAQDAANKKFDERIDVVVNKEIYSETYDERIKAERRVFDAKKAMAKFEQGFYKGKYGPGEILYPDAAKDQQHIEDLKKEETDALDNLNTSLIRSVIGTDKEKKLIALSKGVFKDSQIQELLSTNTPVDARLLEAMNVGFNGKSTFIEKNMLKDMKLGGSSSANNPGDTNLNTSASVSGGGGIKNIYVNFKNMVETQQFNGGVTENAGEIERDVSGLFIRIVRDAELAIG
jgi:tape measure domain-containing protein